MWFVSVNQFPADENPDHPSPRGADCRCSKSTCQRSIQTRFWLSCVTFPGSVSFLGRPRKSRRTNCSGLDPFLNISLKTKLKPGSEAAISAGCLCPVVDNAHGQGYMGMDNVFVMQANCPIHGKSAESDIGIERIEVPPDAWENRPPNTCGPMSVRVKPGEEVNWTWAATADGRSYVCGYTINKKRP